MNYTMICPQIMSNTTLMWVSSGIFTISHCLLILGVVAKCSTFSLGNATSLETTKKTPFSGTCGWPSSKDRSSFSTPLSSTSVYWWFWLALCNSQRLITRLITVHSEESMLLQLLSPSSLRRSTPSSISIISIAGETKWREKTTRYHLPIATVKSSSGSFPATCGYRRDRNNLRIANVQFVPVCLDLVDVAHRYRYVLQSPGSMFSLNDHQLSPSRRCPFLQNKPNILFQTRQSVLTGFLRSVEILILVCQSQQETLTTRGWTRWVQWA